MRYLVVRYEYNSEQQAENRQVYAYDTINEATKQFHSILYQDMNTPSVQKAMVCIVTEYGDMVRNERYDTDVVITPEPEEPEETP